jgi:hypothetical protein
VARGRRSDVHGRRPDPQSVVERGAGEIGTGTSDAIRRRDARRSPVQPQRGREHRRARWLPPTYQHSNYNGKLTEVSQAEKGHLELAE